MVLAIGPNYNIPYVFLRVVSIFAKFLLCVIIELFKTLAFSKNSAVFLVNLAIFNDSSIFNAPLELGKKIQEI